MSTFISEYSSKKSAELKIESAQGSLSVTFPAFLTSFTNSFTSSWNEEQVYGRQDPIGTFQGTKRTINVGFDIIAQNEAEAIENMQKINKLTRMLYPSYTKPPTKSDGTRVVNALVLSKAPLVKLQLANLIQENDEGLLGWIGTWSANPVLEMGMFTGTGNKLFPKVYTATLDFTPQHTQNLAFNAVDNGNPVKFPFSGA